MPRPWKALLLACLGLAALSLLGPSSPTYDPWAWIIWGREIGHLDLNTVSGPSWKPLPVLFTTVFAFFGDAAAPDLWLVVARAGGLLAIAMAYRLGSRLGGRPAGVIAALALLLADEFMRNFWRGNSEGLLVALCLWAVERHLDGRRTDAFLLGFGAALLRPEVWPFFGLYGLWLGVGRAAPPPARARARSRSTACSGSRRSTGARATGCGPPTARASPTRTRRRSPTARSSRCSRARRRSSPCPSCSARSSRSSGPCASGAGTCGCSLVAVAAVLMIVVGLMTEAGFAGNLRYVALPAALVCVLAGVGWVELVRAAGARFGRAAAAALAAVLAAAAAPFVISDIDELRVARAEDPLGGRLLRHAAGRRSRRPAGARRSSAAARSTRARSRCQAVAWHLKAHGGQIGIEPEPPGIVIAAALLAAVARRALPARSS